MLDRNRSQSAFFHGTVPGCVLYRTVAAVTDTHGENLVKSGEGRVTGFAAWAGLASSSPCQLMAGNFKLISGVMKLDLLRGFQYREWVLRITYRSNIYRIYLNAIETLHIRRALLFRFARRARFSACVQRQERPSR